MKRLKMSLLFSQRLSLCFFILFISLNLTAQVVCENENGSFESITDNCPEPGGNPLYDCYWNAFNNLCIPSWGAAHGSPDVCSFVYNDILPPIGGGTYMASMGALYHENTTCRNEAMFTTVDLEPGEEYILTFYHRTAGLSELIPLELKIYQTQGLIPIGPSFPNNFCSSFEIPQGSDLIYEETYSSNLWVQESIPFTALDVQEQQILFVPENYNSSKWERWLVDMVCIEKVCVPTDQVASGSINNWCPDIMPPVKDVIVKVTGTPNCVDLTGTDGLYDCLGSSNFVIKPKKDINIRNGVTTFDLTIINKHITGVVPFTSPFEYVAADINNDGIVSTFDLPLLRNVILFIDDYFPNNTSWRFHDASIPLPLVPNVVPTLSPSIVEDACRENNDFIGIKIGDLNCTANPQNFGGGGSEGIAYLSNSQGSYQAGEIVSIPLRLLEDKNLSGLQLGLRYDTKALDYIGLTNIQLNNFGSNNYNDGTEGEIGLSWVISSQFISSQEPLINLEFVTKVAIKDIANYLTLQDVPGLKSEIYPFDLSIETLAFNEPNTGKEASLYDDSQKFDNRISRLEDRIEIYPNPTNNLLHFEAGINRITELSIINTNSQLVEKLEIDNLQKGKIEFQDIPPGIYFLRFINTKNEIKIKKVVIIK